jgi:outer membrane protein assembly factor BamA
VAPGFFFNKNTAYAEMALTHRQYIPLIHNRLNFAYRATYETTIGGAGKPFYAMPHLLSSYQTGVLMEGLGGNRSLRGVMRNRVIGDGIVLGNLELRYRMFDFKILKQNVNVIPHVFFDTGRVVKFTKMNLDAVPEAEREKFFDIGAEKFHSTAGIGARLLFNNNFVLSGELGKAFNEKDGNGKMGIYVGANVLF